MIRWFSETPKSPSCLPCLPCLPTGRRQEGGRHGFRGTSIAIQYCKLCQIILVQLYKLKDTRKRHSESAVADRGISFYQYVYINEMLRLLPRRGGESVQHDTLLFLFAQYVQFKSL